MHRDVDHTDAGMTLRLPSLVRTPCAVSAALLKALARALRSGGDRQRSSGLGSGKADEGERRRLMAEGHARKSPRRKEEDDSSPPPDKAKKETQENETAAITDKVLEDIDDALRAPFGLKKDDIVSDEELSKLARLYVDNYQQKGGQ